MENNIKTLSELQQKSKLYCDAKITIDIKNLDYELYFDLLRHLNHLCLRQDSSKVNYETNDVEVYEQINDNNE